MFLLNAFLFKKFIEIKNVNEHYCHSIGMLIPRYMTTHTVQLGYCDSDVTVCLLFWNMPIIQDRDVKFPYKRYTYYLQAY